MIRLPAAAIAALLLVLPISAHSDAPSDASGAVETRLAVAAESTTTPAKAQEQTGWEPADPGKNRRITPEAVRMEVREVNVTPTRLKGLELKKSLRLSAENRNFGGFSGLLIEGGMLTAVSDKGWLLTTSFEHIFGNGAAELQRLPGQAGSGNKRFSDAESLARFKGGLAIGFERDHRVELIDDAGNVQVLRHPRFKRMSRNEGLEALATLPGDRLLAIGEQPVDGFFPVFVIHEDGRVDEGTLPKMGRHAITGADLGPDGKLYILRRDWSLLAGISSRIERYEIDDNGFPRAESRERLAAFDTASGIDNMEGIAVWEEEGAMKLAILSDDNFNPLQRTLLLLFDITD